jgi:hypothetical protein
MDCTTLEQLARACVLVKIMKKEVLINLLLAMEGSRKPSSRREMVGLRKCALTLFKVLQTDPLNVERMPANLALTVVRMTVKSWNNPTQP